MTNMYSNELNDIAGKRCGMRLAREEAIGELNEPVLTVGDKLASWQRALKQAW